MIHLTDDELLDWIDGCIPEGKDAVWQHHLDTCPDCEGRYQQLLAVHTSLAVLPLEMPSLRFTQQVLAQVVPQTAIRTCVSRKPLWICLGILGTLLLCAVVALFGLPTVASFAPWSATLDGVMDSARVWSKDLLWYAVHPMVLYLLGILQALLLLVLLNKGVLFPYFVRQMAWKE